MRLLLAALAVLSLCFAPAPFPRTQRRHADPSANVEGLWQGPHELLITQAQMIYNPRREPQQRATYFLRVNRGIRPASYDLRIAEQGTAMFQGIYKVEGDTLTLSYAGGGRPRPTTFDGKVGRVEVYKRVRR